MILTILFPTNGYQKEVHKKTNVSSILSNHLLSNHFLSNHLPLFLACAGRWSQLSHIPHSHPEAYPHVRAGLTASIPSTRISPRHMQDPPHHLMRRPYSPQWSQPTSITDSSCRAGDMTAVMSVHSWLGEMCCRKDIWSGHSRELLLRRGLRKNTWSGKYRHICVHSPYMLRLRSNTPWGKSRHVLYIPIVYAYWVSKKTVRKRPL